MPAPFPPRQEHPSDGLISAVRHLRFEPYEGGLVDDKGHYFGNPPGDFALAIKLLAFSGQQPARPLTWHDYLELFVSIDATCRVRIGNSVVTLGAGEVLVMDNLKLHAVLDFAGPRMRAIVVRFLPDFIYSPGSFSIDHLLCVPFHHQIDGKAHVLRRTDPALERVHEALARMLECYFDQTGAAYARAGAKVFFFEILYHLARHFQLSAAMRSEYLRHQELSQRLGKLFDHVSRHHAEKITVAQAATIAGVGARRFTNLFRQAAGMTWVDYLAYVRLTNAARLLKETSLSIAEISSQLGFSDQSYFDRRFKQRFGLTPIQFRHSVVGER